MSIAAVHGFSPQQIAERRDGRPGRLYAGDSFGRMTVLDRYASRNARGCVRWYVYICACTCGAIGRVAAPNVKRTLSCGCWLRERSRTSHYKGGHSGSVEYKIWTGILNRCRNKNNQAYARYGGRGIVVCERWADFPAFLADMGMRPSQKHSVERRDNDGNYSPDNCHWATRTEQANNKKTSSYVTINGVRATVAQWAEKYEISRYVIYKRLRVGWNPVAAVLAERGMSRAEAERRFAEPVSVAA